MLWQIRIQCFRVWISVRLYYIYVLLCSWTVRVLISYLRKFYLRQTVRNVTNYCLSQGRSIFLLHVASKYLNKFLVLQNVFISFII